jgi:hypothetical protein
METPATVTELPRTCEREHCGELAPASATPRWRFCSDYCRVTHWRAERRGAESQAVTTAKTRDTSVVKFAGSVHLDRNDPRDAELWSRLESGEHVTLMIEGRVTKRAETPLFDREGERRGVKLEANVGILTVWHPPTDAQ